jgi:molybdenum cofactor cytidylyltransferase
MPERMRIAAIVLAAGRSTRMGAANKLLADVDGRPMVRVAVEAALASQARPVLVVTGHQPDAVRAALAGLDVAFVGNPTSPWTKHPLRAGNRAVPKEALVHWCCSATCHASRPRTSMR